MSKDRAAFFERYAPYAMIEQEKYGIPASITLAQMCLESGTGSSRLAREGNNYFGIKEGVGWKGDTILADDDKPNEKFRKYDKVYDSIKDHSLFLMQKRYEKCRRLDSTDSEGWAKGLQAAGYATDKGYAAKLMEMIAIYKLDRYDHQAAVNAEQRGVKCGQNSDKHYQSERYSSQNLAVDHPGQSLSFGMPLRNGDRMTLTSDYGYRNIEKGEGSRNHAGIDLRAAKGTSVYASEDGIVIGTGYQPRGDNNPGGGNYIYVAYPRQDGSFRVAGYLHLDNVTAKVGEHVDANTVIGKSGNTGGVSPHLDFRVAKVEGQAADRLRDFIENDCTKSQANIVSREYNDLWTSVRGYKGDNSKDAKNGDKKKYGNFMDPKLYLAEIAKAGHLNSLLIDNKNNKDVLANAKQQVTDEDVRLLAQKQSQGKTDDMEHSLFDHMTSSLDDGNVKDGNSMNFLQQLAMGGSSDLISSLIQMAMMLLFSTMSGKSKEEKQAATHNLAKNMTDKTVNKDSYTIDREEGEEKDHQNSKDVKKVIEKGKMMYDMARDQQIQSQEQDRQRGVSIG